MSLPAPKAGADVGSPAAGPGGGGGDVTVMFDTPDGLPPRSRCRESPLAAVTVWRAGPLADTRVSPRRDLRRPRVYLKTVAALGLAAPCVIPWRLHWHSGRAGRSGSGQGPPSSRPFKSLSRCQSLARMVSLRRQS